jgi:hypothetical protein
MFFQDKGASDYTHQAEWHLAQRTGKSSLILCIFDLTFYESVKPTKGSWQKPKQLNMLTL